MAGSGSLFGGYATRGWSAKKCADCCGEQAGKWWAGCERSVKGGRRTAEGIVMVEDGG